MAMRRTIFEPEHETFRDDARRFFQQEIGPNGERWREAAVVGREACLKAGEQGYLMMWTDEKYGGAGVQAFRYEQVLIEENIRHGESSFYLNLHSPLVGPYIGQLGNDEQKERRIFGKPLGAFQNTRFKLADLRAQLDAAQCFVDTCVMEHLDGRLSADLAAEAKLLASELEFRTADDCLQLFGGAGYMDEYRISRLWTTARVSRIYAGTSEIMKEIISRSIGLDDRKMT